MLGYFELILTFIQTKLHFKPAAICNLMSLTLYHCCKGLVSPYFTLQAIRLITIIIVLLSYLNVTQ